MFGFLDNWADKFQKDLEHKLPNCDKIAIGVEYALSQFCQTNNIINNMDGSRAVQGLIDTLVSKPGSLSVGKPEEASVIAAFVIGATQGEISKYFNLATLSSDELVDMTTAIIIYRYAKSGKIETQAHAQALIEMHSIGFQRELQPLKAMAQSYVQSKYDKTYLNKGVLLQDNQPAPSIEVENMMQDAINGEGKWVSIGRSIALDCLENGLRKGQPVFLDQLTQLINQDYDYGATQVHTGFMKGMMDFIESGEVQSFSIEGKGDVFIHRDYVKSILNI